MTFKGRVRRGREGDGCVCVRGEIEERRGIREEEMESGVGEDV